MEFFRQCQRTLQVFTKMWKYLKLSNHHEASFKNLKRRYAEELARHLRLEVGVTQSTPQPRGPAIYVCNHISYLDIPLIMKLLPDACFVSKSEIAAWPVIGKAARRIETVFVKRENKESRQAMRESLVSALQNENKKIIVFPSGTTTIYKTERWRKGVFEVAQACNVPVIPLRLEYRPLRDIAYIDDDNFILHLFKLVTHARLNVQIEFGASERIENPLEDCARIQAWCEGNMAPA
jgi:1-acyl-sn-glycerol-3-phosphate acyltransferase